MLNDNNIRMDEILRRAEDKWFIFEALKVRMCFHILKTIYITIIKMNRALCIMLKMIAMSIGLTNRKRRIRLKDRK